MRLIDKYIAKTLMWSTAIALLLLLGLEMLFALANEMRYIGDGDYQLLEAFFYLLLTIPQRIYQMFPMSALLGSLMGLGMLASQSELIAMRAASLSIIQIAKIILKTGLFMSIGMWCIGEIVAPYTDRVAENQKAFAISGGQALKTSYGIWMRDKGTFIHIKKMMVTGTLEGVTRYEYDKNFQLKRASYAEHAKYEGEYWHFRQIKETKFYPDSTESRTLPEENWQSGISPGLLRRVGAKKMDEQSLYGLWESIQYRQENNLSHSEYTLAFWKKISQPFASIMMIFLSIPFIFGPLRSSTMGFKLFIGILVGFGFRTLNDAFGPLSLVYHLPPFLGATLPTLLFAGVAMWMLKKIR